MIHLSKGIQILIINICWQKHTLKYWSRAPFSMYSVIIMASLTEIISRREHPVKTCTVLWNGILKYWKLWFDRMILTFSDNTLQTDYVLMGKLAHNTGFTKEVQPLLLSVAWLQGLYGYSDLTCVLASSENHGTPHQIHPVEQYGNTFVNSKCKLRCLKRKTWQVTIF